MKIPLYIEKESAEDCPYCCLFRNEEVCTLFNEDLKIGGYYDSITREACFSCQRLYNNIKQTKEEV